MQGTARFLRLYKNSWYFASVTLINSLSSRMDWALSDISLLLMTKTLSPLILDLSLRKNRFSWWRQVCRWCFHTHSCFERLLCSASWFPSGYLPWWLCFWLCRSLWNPDEWFPVFKSPDPIQSKKWKHSERSRLQCLQLSHMSKWSSPWHEVLRCYQRKGTRRPHQVDLS